MFASRVMRLASAAGKESGVAHNLDHSKPVKVFLPVAAVLNALIFFNLSHEHEEPVPAYPYLKVRAKKFPWGSGNCGLWEDTCYEAERAAKKGEKAPAKKHH